MTPARWFLILLLLALPTHALVTGVERPVSAPEFGTPFSVQYPAAIATDGNDFVVLWIDNDLQRLSSVHVSADGELPSVPSQLVANDGAIGVKLFWTGTGYTAFWISFIAADNDYGVKIARLDRRGALLEPVRTLFPHMHYLDVAWNGRNFLMLREAVNQYEALILSADGQVVKSGIEFPVGDVSGYQSVVAVGETFWLFHSTQTIAAVSPYDPSNATDWYFTTYAHRVNAAGELLDAQPLTIGTIPRPARIMPVVSNGRSLLSIGFESGPQLKMYAFAIDAATGSVTPVQQPLAGYPGNSVLATDGTDYLLAWISPDQAMQRLRFDADGALVRGSIPTDCCSGSAYSPVMAFNGRAFFASWGDNRDFPPFAGGSHLFGELFDSGGNPLHASERVAMRAHLQNEPSTAGSLATWAELTDDGYRFEVRAAREGKAPVVLSTPSPRIDSTATLFTGSSYFVAWTEQTKLDPPSSSAYIRRLGLDGQPLDAAPRLLGEAGWGGVSLGFDGTNVLAVWSGTAGLAGQRISPAGEVIDATPFVIAPAGHHPRIAWNGSEYLVTWTEGTAFCPGVCRGNLRDVNAARVTASGMVLDTIAIADASLDEHDQVVASDGRDFLIAYTIDTLTGTPTQTATKRVLANGSVIGGASVAHGTSLGATWRDGTYLIAIVNPDDLHVISVDAATGNATGDTLIAANAFSEQPFGDGPAIIYGREGRVFTNALFGALKRRSTR